MFPETYPNTPVGNFEYFWQEFDQFYGLFQVRAIDWDSAYAQFRPQVDLTTTDTELYETLVDMLQLLDDGHVALIPIGTDLPQYVGGPIGRIDTIQDFNLEIIKTRYLNDPQETDFAMLYDVIEDSIGYVHIYGFADGEKAFDREMEILMEAVADTKGLIIDIRGGYGGEDIAGKTIASYFTDQERLYMTNRVKNGPGPLDFTEPVSWYIRPRGEAPYLHPIVLLTNRLTVSARETFELAMRTLPQVTVVGDTSAGAFSNNMLSEMPNGWGFSFSIGDWRAADGTSYEGVGIPPDVLIQNLRSELLDGQDRVLDKALEVLR
ncbi:MAG: S41 family peptidase [Phaeodactylibacter sp.]|nr:S41 family peptidase [Phaeodactylibacter sp.]